MKFINMIAQAVGYTVIVMWLLGSTTPMDFQIRFASQAVGQDENIYSCDAGDTFWTRRKYLCGRDEWASQHQQNNPQPSGD